MRPYVKLRWPLVIIVVEGVTFPPAWGDRDPCDHFIRKQLEPRSSEYQEVYTNVMKTGASSVRQIIKVRAYVGRRFHFFSSGPSYIHLSPFTFNPFLFYVPSMPQFPTKRSFFSRRRFDEAIVALALRSIDESYFTTYTLVRLGLSTPSGSYFYFCTFVYL